LAGTRKKRAAISLAALFQDQVSGSGRGCDLGIALGARAARAATRGAWRFGVGGDRRRKHLERDALFGAVLVLLLLPGLVGGAPPSRLALARTIIAVLTLTIFAWAILTGTLLARLARAIAALVALTVVAVRALAIIGFVAIVVAIVAVSAGLGRLVLILVLVGEVVTLAALLLEARAAFVQYAEIMIRELEIIFGLHAIAGELRVARHRLIFLVKLGGIAALTIVLAVAWARHVV
jgi:hypothetical protein